MNNPVHINCARYDSYWELICITNFTWTKYVYQTNDQYVLAHHTCLNPKVFSLAIIAPSKWSAANSMNEVGYTN